MTEQEFISGSPDSKVGSLHCVSCSPRAGSHPGVRRYGITSSWYKAWHTLLDNDTLLSRVIARCRAFLLSTFHVLSKLIPRSSMKWVLLLFLIYRERNRVLGRLRSSLPGIGQQVIWSQTFTPISQAPFIGLAQTRCFRLQPCHHFSRRYMLLCVSKYLCSGY